ncbi:hypothetical protein [Luteimonas sp. R10]|uniref:hypothetical protein n=1 Tax=Luteimonas sp. R10 TaxID=3108176 RepID=UPI00308957FA|nr:hypothetical protein U3649_04930 [Luteimonas sp. R10]
MAADAFEIREANSIGHPITSPCRLAGPEPGGYAGAIASGSFEIETRPGSEIAMHNFKRNWTGLLLVACFVAAPAALANDDTQSAAGILQQQRDIRQDILAKERGWDAIDASKRDQVIARQDKVFDRLADVGTLDELNPTEITELSNDLEWIRSIAMDAENERMVCTREKKTGTNRVQRVCRTAGQIAREQAQASEEWQRLQSHNPAPPPETP